MTNNYASNKNIVIITTIFLLTIIDSLDGLTFRNQLMSILLVMPTGQHLHAIFSFLAYGGHPR